MSYEKYLRKMYSNIKLDIEDLYLLESYQIGYLPDRVPPREFVSVLWAYPSLKRFFISKNPEIETFINNLIKKHEPATSPKELAEHGDKLVWEIADMIIYCKHPEALDKIATLTWSFTEIISVVDLKNKIVVDAGAGTGRLAFKASETAKVVYAVEPNTSLRQFIREKAAKTKTSNLFTIDGFLHAIPFPNESVDVLITSRAFGWHLEKELHEIERVVKKGGFAIHLSGYPFDEDNPVHSVVTSPNWKYQHSRYKENTGWKSKYWKKIE
ncbi:class I SAM-dependent methyltransferase [candidate division KSB1 bacterium]|nr:class I SAM-dependent methyltransferase [candidate division KSB1 bacterium]